jgi:hypothetical protein
LKYQKLGDKQFDLVVFYHGINDTRLNNCPREMFRADYTHCSWYDRIERLNRHPELNFCVLPYTLEYCLVGLLDSRRFNRYLPRNAPDDGLWFADGEDIKTADSFRENLQSFLDLARERGAEVMLPTYAYYIPENYSAEGVRARSLDWATHSAFVEMWGTPRGVSRGIDAHNEVIRSLAARNPHVLFTDLAKSMPHGKAWFNDICHLTTLGSQFWVDSFNKPLDRWLAETGRLRATTAATAREQR